MPLDQPDTSDPVESFRMPLGEHLEELRKRLIRALIGQVLALGISLYYCFPIMAWIATPLLQAQLALGYTPQTISTDASSGFLTVYLPVALIASLIIASPWIIYQLWQFIVTGLYHHERRAIYILAPFSTLMTLLAVAFTRYVLLPVCVVFFLSFAANSPTIKAGEPEWLIRQLTGYEQPPANEDPSPTPLQLPVIDGPPAELTDGLLWIDRKETRLKLFVGGKTHSLILSNDRLVNPMPDLGMQIKFAAMLGLGIVIAFQTPVFMLVLGWTGLVDPKQVAGLRRYALFATAGAGAVLTPADPASMFMLWIPLYLLFEFGLLLMRIVDPHKNPPAEL